MRNLILASLAISSCFIANLALATGTVKATGTAKCEAGQCTFTASQPSQNTPEISQTSQKKPTIPAGAYTCADTGRANKPYWSAPSLSACTVLGQEGVITCLKDDGGRFIRDQPDPIKVGEKLSYTCQSGDSPPY